MLHAGHRGAPGPVVEGQGGEQGQDIIGSAPVSSLTGLNNQLNDLFKVAQ